MSMRVLTCLSLCLLLTSCFGSGTHSPAPVVHHGQNNGAGSAGVHNVVRGDTLYSISQRYNIPMRDIAILNRVQPPFQLYEGQRLRLPPPQEYRVRTGDTLYGVSRLFGVQSSEVAQLNDIQSPYILRVGQVLRLPSVSAQGRGGVRKVQAQKPQGDHGRKVEQDGVPTPQGKPSANKVASQSAQDGVIRPSQKPQNSVVTDGVPRPQSKPAPRKVTKITKVNTKAPKRASSRFLRPVRGRVLSNFGAKKSGLHNDGINISAPRGTPVKVAENGVVVYTGNALKGSGNLVLVRHENRWMTAYAHLDKISVKKGQVLRRGNVLGKVGSSGSVSKPQLHFEIRRGTDALNPMKYMEK